MARLSHVLVIALSGVVMATAIPQYGGGGGAAAPPPPPPPPPPPSASLPSYASSSAAAPPPPGPSAPAPAAPSFPSASPVGSSSSSSSGGDLTVQCKASPDGSGNIKYDCSGVNKDAITLKTEHFLWLENQAGKTQNLDIEIPNYNIDEFIKAAYKALGPQEGAKINILLKKPDVTYNAQKEEPPAQQAGQPSVSVNYQPVDKVSVHYPTQKQYSNGGSSSSSSSVAAPPPPAPAPPAPAAPAPAPYNPAPAAPAPPAPAATAPAPYNPPSAAPAGGAYNRPQRESGYRYYFIRQ